MKKILFVVSGGELKTPTFFREKINEIKPAEIICADGGARHLFSLDIRPDVIIGDMDSLHPELLSYFEGQGSRIIRHPEDKDETDTWLALDYAIQMAPDEIYLFAALGTRIDHTQANLSLLALGKRNRIPIKLIDEWCEIFLVTDRCVIEGEVGQTVSILPFSGVAAGITLEGFEYSIENAVMEMGKPYGISNRLVSPRGIITVLSGELLVVRYFRPGFLPEGFS